VYFDPKMGQFNGIPIGDFRFIQMDLVLEAENWFKGLKRKKMKC
jgi:hypothetical protein